VEPRRIGIDVGGSGVKAALVDMTTGAVDGRERTPTPQPATPDAVAGVIAQLVADLDDATGPIGCTLPGVVRDGILTKAPNLDPSWIGADAHALLTAATGRECIVLNDADAAGLGEMEFGAARGQRGVVVMVTLGTGVGTAVFNDRRLLPNTELGHIVVHGHVADTWASANARDVEELTWKDWSARVNKFLTELHALMWPDLFVLGGGVVKKADKFLHFLDPGCEVRPAALGNNAGIVGAALVALGAVSTSGV
jgi:polyphosphate glucokinase